MHRVPVMFDQQLLDEVDAFGRDVKCRNRSENIRRLVGNALRMYQAQSASSSITTPVQEFIS